MGGGQAARILARILMIDSSKKYSATLVPKKGLEPPHPCGYMDLNHARLPIPPLRHGMERAAIATRGSGSKVIVQVPSGSSQCSNALRHSLSAFRQSHWLVAMRRAETKSIA